MNWARESKPTRPMRWHWCSGWIVMCKAISRRWPSSASPRWPRNRPVPPAGTGLKQRMGAITKHGNPRLRRVLIELAWRVVRYQPEYPPVRHWRTVLLTGHAGARKKAVVAIARKLAIDQWRLATRRTTAEALQLKMN